MRIFTKTNYELSTVFYFRPSSRRFRTPQSTPVRSRAKMPRPRRRKKGLNSLQAKGAGASGWPMFLLQPARGGRVRPPHRAAGSRPCQFRRTQPYAPKSFNKTFYATQAWISHSICGCQEKSAGQSSRQRGGAPFVATTSTTAAEPAGIGAPVIVSFPEASVQCRCVVSDLPCS